MRPMMRTAAALAALFVISLMASPVHAQTVPTCFGHKATLVGTAGDDVFQDGAGTDVIVGLGGNDEFTSAVFQDDEDFWCGNSGDETFRISLGDDHVSGGRGHDVFLMGAGGEGRSDGNDVIDGGGDEDYGDYIGAARVNLRTGSSTGPETDSDVLSGIEDLFAGDGPVVFIGDSGPNFLGGNEDHDVLKGKGGDDRLFADDNPDSLYGGAGEDTCIAREGIDLIVSCEHILPR